MPRDGLIGSTREPCEPVIGRNRRLLSRQVRPNGLNCGYKVSVAEAGRPMPGAVSGMKSTPFWLGAGLFGRDRLMCCQSSSSCVWNQWSCSPSGSLSAPIRAVQIAGPGCRATGPHIVSAAVTPVPCRGRYHAAGTHVLCFTGNIHRWFCIDEPELCPLEPEATETGHLSPINVGEASAVPGETSGFSSSARRLRRQLPMWMRRPPGVHARGELLREGLRNGLIELFGMIPGVVAVLKGRRLRMTVRFHVKHIRHIRPG